MNLHLRETSRATIMATDCVPTVEEAQKLPESQKVFEPMGNMKALNIKEMPYDEYQADGDVLVFLHGFPDDRSLWKKQIERFRNHFHILNFNLPVVKRRDAFQFETLFLTIKNKMLSIVQRYPEKKFILIGHDLGTLILEETARRLPVLVKGQILISGMSMSQFSSRRYSPSQLLKSWYVFLLQLPGAPRILSHFLPRSVYLYQELPKSLPHRRNKSEIKTLFIFGKDDLYLNPVTEDESRKFHSQFQTVTLKGGHWIQKEKANEVNKIIEHFLEKIKQE